MLVNRTLGYVTASAPVFSPNGDGRFDSIDLGFLLVKPAEVRVRIVRNDKWAANVSKAQLGAGAQTVAWDGKKPGGRLRDGAYEAEVIARNEVGTVSQRVPISVDTTAPSCASSRCSRCACACSSPSGCRSLNGSGRPSTAIGPASCRFRRRRCARCASWRATRPGT